jgi:hypothetical protein
MSDTSTQVDPETPDDENPNFKQLREAEKQRSKELADARREIAVMKSGIDSESKLGQLFLKSYDGEVSPDAIKAAAEEYGIPLASRTETPVVDDAPLAETGTEVRQALADNAPADTGVVKDPNEIAMDNWKADLASGAREEDAMGTWVRSMAEGALNGDPRVIAE